MERRKQEAGPVPEPGATDETLRILMAGAAQARRSMEAANAQTHRDHVAMAETAARSVLMIPSAVTATLSDDPTVAGQLGSLLLQAVVLRGERVPDGRIIEVIAPPWFAIYQQLRRDPKFMFQISAERFEELIAGAYDLAGYRTVLTPRSGDLGRDVIATRNDGVEVRILDQTKRYGPGQEVRYDAIRSLLFVLDADHACKGFLTTTGVFPPNLMKDRLIAPLIGTRLELVPGSALVARLKELSGSKI